MQLGSWSIPSPLNYYTSLFNRSTAFDSQLPSSRLSQLHSFDRPPPFKGNINSSKSCKCTGKAKNLKAFTPFPFFYLSQALDVSPVLPPSPWFLASTSMLTWTLEAELILWNQCAHLLRFLELSLIKMEFAWYRIRIPPPWTWEFCMNKLFAKCLPVVLRLPSRYHWHHRAIGNNCNCSCWPAWVCPLSPFCTSVLVFSIPYYHCCLSKSDHS